LIVSPPKASSLRDLQYEELFHDRVCVVVAPQHPFARRRAIPLTEVAAEPLIGLTHEDYPEYYDYLSIAFSKVKQKPRVVEEHDSMAGILSSVEAGTGVAICADVFGYSYGNRLKRLRLIPEPKPDLDRLHRTKGSTQPCCRKILAVRERSGLGQMIAIT
jgi:DNA-binding transcriptional LysR family regulator